MERKLILAKVSGKVQLWSNGQLSHSNYKSYFRGYPISSFLCCPMSSVQSIFYGVWEGKMLSGQSFSAR